MQAEEGEPRGQNDEIQENDNSAIDRSNTIHEENGEIHVESENVVVCSGEPSRDEIAVNENVTSTESSTEIRSNQPTQRMRGDDVGQEDRRVCVSSDLDTAVYSRYEFVRGARGNTKLLYVHDIQHLYYKSFSSKSGRTFGCFLYKTCKAKVIITLNGICMRKGSNKHSHPPVARTYNHMKLKKKILGERNGFNNDTVQQVFDANMLKYVFTVLFTYFDYYSFPMICFQTIYLYSVFFKRPLLWRMFKGQRIDRSACLKRLSISIS